MRSGRRRRVKRERIGRREGWKFKDVGEVEESEITGMEKEMSYDPGLHLSPLSSEKENSNLLVLA